MGWLNRLFFLKTQLHAACKRLTSALRRPILQVKEWKKIFHVNGNPKKPGVAISVKQTLSQTVTGDKEGHSIMTKGSIHQEDTTLVNYAPR